MSEFVVVKLPEIASGDIILENILSISVLEWQVLAVCWRMDDKKEAREWNNLLAGLW